MMFQFRMTSKLFTEIQEDLIRSHEFALERVGFVFAKIALRSKWCTVLAHSFESVKDEDYIEDPNVCARFGPDAMHKTMCTAFENRDSVFHVHLHSGTGIPRFSHIDLMESEKFVPNFFNVRPEMPHGTIVLNESHAFGHIWLSPQNGPHKIEEFHIVGPHYRKWRIK